MTQQLDALRAALNATHRLPDEVNRLLLDGLNDERPLVSLNAFVDWAGRYRELGITELVIHWPEPNSIFDNDIAIFEAIALEGMAQLGEEP